MPAAALSIADAVSVTYPRDRQHGVVDYQSAYAVIKISANHVTQLLPLALSEVEIRLTFLTLNQTAGNYGMKRNLVIIINVTWILCTRPDEDYFHLQDEND